MTADPQDRRELAERLLPCPFCGSPAKRAPSNDTDPDASPPFIGCGLCDVWFDDAASWNRRQPSEGREPDGWMQASDIAAWRARKATLVHMAESPRFEGQEMVPVYFGAAPTPEPEHPRDEARRRGPLPPEWFGGLGDKTD